MLRIDRLGGVTVYAGPPRPLSAQHVVNPEYPTAQFNPINLAQDLDGSVLVLDCKTRGHLFRLNNGVTFLLAGTNDNNYPLDPQYLPHADLAPKLGGMAVLEDGSILFSSMHGLRLLSPADALQGVLERLVEAGKTAARNHHLTEYQGVKRDLELLCEDSARTLRAVNREGRNGRLGASGLRPALYADVMTLVLAHATQRPVEKWRARMALMELMTYRP